MWRRVDNCENLKFPLGFCPGSRKTPGDPSRDFQCVGEWSIVIKEWGTITMMYPTSARNLNRASKQVARSGKKRCTYTCSAG